MKDLQARRKRGNEAPLSKQWMLHDTLQKTARRKKSADPDQLARSLSRRDAIVTISRYHSSELPCGQDVRVSRERVNMSKKSAEHHRKAAEHHEHAAKHHLAAADHHEAGDHEKAGHHAQVAMAHSSHASDHAEEASKHHANEHAHH